MYVSKNDQRRFQDPEFSTKLQRPPLERVRAIVCPVLVVHGERSTVLTAAAAHRFVDSLPHGRLETVANASHNVHTQNPVAFLNAVEPFLR